MAVTEMEGGDDCKRRQCMLQWREMMAEERGDSSSRR